MPVSDQDTAISLGATTSSIGNCDTKTLVGDWDTTSSLGATISSIGNCVTKMPVGDWDIATSLGTATSSIGNCDTKSSCATATCSVCSTSLQWDPSLSSSFVGFDPQFYGPLSTSCCAPVATSLPLERERTSLPPLTDFSSSVNCCLNALPFEGQSTCILTYDTGASRPFTGICSDFEDNSYTPTTNGPILDGIASGLEIEGFGYTRYHIKVADRSIIILCMKSYYVPGLKNTCLISPKEFSPLLA